MDEITTIRVFKSTVKRFRKHKPYEEVSDDKALNLLLDQLDALKAKKPVPKPGSS